MCAARSTPDYPQLLVLNAILGGEFVSRLNLNLRESKGYTYGVRTGSTRRGIGPFVMQTSVGTDVTGPAIREALAEIHAIADDRQATGDEVALAFASSARDTRAASKRRDKWRAFSHSSRCTIFDTYFRGILATARAVRPMTSRCRASIPVVRQDEHRHRRRPG